MSDSGTSPTYGDTPVAVSVAKYIVIAALVGALTVAMWLSKILWLQSRFGLWLALAASFFGLYALARGIYLRSDGLISVGFFALASVMLIIFVTHFSPPLSVMTSILMLFGIVSLAAESIQIILYLVFGRLPALGYKHSLSVRFGSIWDDPNGFAFMIALLLPLFFMSIQSKWPRYLLVGGLLVVLLLTQSITGVVAVITAGSVSGIFLMRRWKSTVLVLFVIALAAFVLLFLLSKFAAVPIISDLLQGKSGSIAQHLDGGKVLTSIGLSNWLGFGSHAVVAESGYVSLIANVGVPMTVLFIVLGLLALSRVFLHSRKSAPSAIEVGMFTFISAVLLGMTSLSLQSVFPINFLYFIAIALSCSDKKVKTRDTQPA